MAIPKFEDFLYPFLIQLKDKDVSTKEMKDALVKHFNLTEEDCSLKTKSGSATKGVFITTSKFTSGAVETANKANKKIVLIDGKSLADYMIEYNVGVSEKKIYKKIYEVKKLDSDYFEE